MCLAKPQLIHLHLNVISGFCGLAFPENMWKSNMATDPVLWTLLLVAQKSPNFPPSV